MGYVLPPVTEKVVLLTEVSGPEADSCKPLKWSSTRAKEVCFRSLKDWFRICSSWEATTEWLIKIDRLRQVFLSSVSAVSECRTSKTELCVIRQIFRVI